MKKSKKMDLEKIEETLGVIFRDKEFLKRAFTHRSFLNENQDVEKHNERLEYLGDAVLEFLVSKFLFKNYPDRAEGDLTSFRSATVRTGTLAETGSELNFGEYLRMSRGEEKTGGRHKEYLLANTFEAVIGAMYLDQGIRKTEAFLNRVLFPKIDNIVKNRLDIDPKTRFQELAQDHQKVTPTYELLSEKGPDHNKEFTMAVYLGTTEYGRGEGPSKQRAEEEAAKRGLQKITDQISSEKG